MQLTFVMPALRCILSYRFEESRNCSTIAKTVNEIKYTWIIFLDYLNGWTVVISSCSLNIDQLRFYKEAKKNLCAIPVTLVVYVVRYGFLSVVVLRMLFNFIGYVLYI